VSQTNLSQYSVHTDPIPGVDFDLWFTSKQATFKTRMPNESYQVELTVRPDLLRNGSFLEECSPRSLLHRVADKGRNPLKLRRQGILGSGIKRRALGNVGWVERPQLLKFRNRVSWEPDRVDILTELVFGAKLFEMSNGQIQDRNASTNVTLRDDIPKRVPSSSHTPRYVGFRYRTGRYSCH